MAASKRPPASLKRPAGSSGLLQVASASLMCEQRLGAAIEGPLGLVCLASFTDGLSTGRFVHGHPAVRSPVAGENGCNEGGGRSSARHYLGTSERREGCTERVDEEKEGMGKNSPASRRRTRPYINTVKYGNARNPPAATSLGPIVSFFERNIRIQVITTLTMGNVTPIAGTVQNVTGHPGASLLPRSLEVLLAALL